MNIFKNKKQTKDVFEITDSTEGRKNWNKLGAAFVNKDGSLNVVFNSMPIGNRIQIRDRKYKNQTQS